MNRTASRRVTKSLAFVFLTSLLLYLGGCSSPISLANPNDGSGNIDSRAAGDYVLYFKYTGTGTPQAYAWIPSQSNLQLFGTWAATTNMTAVSGATGWWSADVSAKSVASGTQVGVIFKLADGTKLSGSTDQLRTTTGWCRMENSIPVWYTSNPDSTPPASPAITPTVAGIDTNTDIFLATTTAGAKIYYTIDGSIPTAASTVYSASFKLPVGNVTVKAIAILTGSPSSAVTTKTYTVTQGVTNSITVYTKGYTHIYWWSPVPTGSVGATTWPGATLTADPSGWVTKSFTGVTSINLIFSNNGSGQTADLNRTTGTWWYKAGAWTDYNPDTLPTVVATPSILPKTDTLTTNDTVSISTTTTGATIYYTTTGADPTTASSVYSAPFKLTVGTKTVKALGVKSGLTNSAIAAQTYTVTTPPPAGITVHAKGYTHIYYWSAVPAGSPANATWPGVAMTNDAAGWPTYSFPSATSINIIFSNAGAGQTPDLSRTTGEWWYKAGVWTNSNPEAAVIPVITSTPNPGKFNTTQSVKLAGSNTDDKIYYTTNGTTPTTASTLFTGTAISVSTPTTIKAFGVNRDGGQGAVASFFFDVSSAYDLTAPTITPSVAPGSFPSAQLVSFTFNDNKGGITAYYTTDGTMPTTSTTTKVTTTGTSVSTASFNVTARTVFNIMVMDTAGNRADGTFTYNIGTNARNDFREETIYFVMTTRFYDGDSSNNFNSWDESQISNPISDPAWRGDFRGLTDKLDYIKALGFSAIWLTPPVKNMSGLDYHGYHAVNFKKIDPRYKTTGDASADESYQKFINAAHAKGIKVIQDIVLNHSSNFGEENLFPLFEKDSTGSYTNSAVAANLIPNATLNAAADRLAAQQGKTRAYILTNQPYQARLEATKTVAGDPAWLYKHGSQTNWNQWSQQDGDMAGDCRELNTENYTTAKYLMDAMDQYIGWGVDAFRIDTVKHISRTTFNNFFLPHFKQTGGENFFMFGECANIYSSVWDNGIPAQSTPHYTWKESKSYPWSFDPAQWAVNQQTTKDHWTDNLSLGGQPSSNNYLLNGNNYRTPDYSQASGLSMIDFCMHHNFGNAGAAFDIKQYDNTYNDATTNVVYVDSHDYGPNNDGGLTQRYNGSEAALAENMSLMFTFRGIPTIYYGTEIQFMKGAQIEPWGNGRVPFAQSGRAYYGDKIVGTVSTTDFGKYTASGTVAATLQHSLAQHIRRLNLIRRAVPALQKGQYTTADVSGGIAYKKRFTNATTDSFALVAVSCNATFSNLPAGTYKDVVTGDTKTIAAGGSITANASGQANLRVYVLNTALTPAPGVVGDDAAYQAAATKYMN